jgi:hypothetical protein
MDFKIKGGLCKLRGKPVIIMDRRTPLTERVALLVGALRQFDLSSVFIRPYIRSIIGERSDQHEN